MFDVGFFELLLLGVVALLVIGPERLPKVARTAGMWIGRGRRILQSVKADIEQELRAEELKRILKEQAASTPVHEILEEGRSTLDEVKKETESVVKQAADEAASTTSTLPSGADRTDDAR
ncbi:MAG TPA: twin-arginine translocase subunit TatB [Thiolapillus brandeum]|uniref:Sec-independent protein translocase protein TatB n=1 Tax=Thiolapillus brandeum TaxID=1076588 RepID=A0A7C5MZL8_9GAMM|nr:twin-arginine translocase subunit TatB [Thiolapillus brandeum]